MELKEGTALEMLRQFAVSLNAELKEDFGASQLILNNKNGKGGITLFEVFPGLTAWVYDIKFNQNYNFVHNFTKKDVYYFGYHISGHQMTKFPTEPDYKKINKGQNFILTGELGNRAEFYIPAGIDYQCCYLIVQTNLLDENRTKIKVQLKEHLKEILDLSKETFPYRYFGDIDFRTGLYTEIVIKNKRTDLVGRLLTEAAILNMLASQIEAHDHDQNIENFQPKLSKTELLKIAGLGDYIQKNINRKLPIEELSAHLGMNRKKIQKGVRFLFGHSINQYITNVRMEFARELFNTSDMNVSEICYQIGYNSRSFFSKLFFERYGVSPNDYRKSLYRDDLLFEISYRSMANSNISSKEIAEILKTSRQNNKDYKITGSLIYHRNVFFQLIEGPKKEVMNLYENIKKDNRHFDVRIIWKGSKPMREFENWNMAMISDEGVLQIPIEGHTHNLNLGHLMGEINEQSLESKNLWQRVRNILKTSTKNDDNLNSAI